MRYFFIFFIFYSPLHALSNSELQQIEDRNRNILLQDKERKNFEQNNHSIVNTNKNIQILRECLKIANLLRFEIRSYVKI